ncbi:MAG: cysteine dioxygenase family protein [Thaumarchaeota archaeon]|nr:cysteine dioxygenase family protein [Nitrososphaerota archaeon]
MQTNLRWFISEIEEAVRTSEGDAEVIRKARPLMAQLLSTKGAITEEAFRPRTDRFAMNLLYRPPDRSFSINGAVWLPRQTTPIHDHLTWAMVGLYEGDERESIFRRLDDGSDPRTARLQMVSERVNKQGHITTLGSAGIHRIDNVSPSPSRSIHVYGNDIGNAERHSYDPTTGEVSRFVSGYCNVLRDEDLDDQASFETS